MTTCEWCSSPATTSVTVEPGGRKGKMVTPPRKAPACADCKKRLLAQPRSIERALKVKASTDAQTTIFDYL